MVFVTLGNLSDVHIVYEFLLVAAFSYMDCIMLRQPRCIVCRFQEPELFASAVQLDITVAHDGTAAACFQYHNVTIHWKVG